MIPGPPAYLRGAAAIGGALLLATAAVLRAEPPDRPRPTPVPGAPLPYELLGVEQAVLLDGKPFPRRQPYPDAAPGPRRTFYVSASGKPGDGTEAKPWGDLQAALSELSAGDRLVVLPGLYSGAFRVDDSCRSGKARAWIQVVSRKATLQPSGEAPALEVARAYWRFDGLVVSGVEGRGAMPLVELSTGAEHVLFNRAHLNAKSGSGLSIGSGARHVILANSRVTGLEKGAVFEPATAVDVRGGASDVTLAADWILDPVGIGIRIGANEAGESEPARDISILDSTVRDCWGPAVLVFSVHGLRIADSDVFQRRMGRVDSSEGVRLESGRKVRLERNHLRGFALAVRVGIGDTDAANSGGDLRDVVIERNYIESQTGRGAAIAVEAGNRIEVVNNVLERIAEGFVLFGRPPRTRDVLVANNLALGIGELAFRIEDFASVSLFDRNFFSPAGELSAEVGSENLRLSDLLARGRMPGTRIVPRLRLRNRDLARVDGLKTVDAGWRVAGLSFKGAAPDLGLAER